MSVRARALKPTFFCHLCDGATGDSRCLAAVVTKKEGATGKAALGMSWISVTCKGNAGGLEWAFSNLFSCIALIQP